MFLPTNVTNRRGFLERSVLGAGSILVAPLLLDSCTDHVIPNPPTNPTNPPQVPSTSVGDLNYWYNQEKSVIITGLEGIPEMGAFPDALVSAIWPDGQPGVWEQVRAQIEALIGQQINGDTYNVVIGKLNTFKALIGEYLNEFNLGTPEQINNKWEDVTDQFDDSQPFFTAPGYELLLLPFFAQFASLYLALLRDGVVYGQSWGRTDGEIQTYAKKCRDKISEFTAYTTKWYNSGRAIKMQTTRDDQQCEPFRSTNVYDRLMTQTVLDYMDTWPYYNIAPDPSDPSIKAYPNGTVNTDGTPIYLFTREIYSDPYGNIFTGDYTPHPIVLPSPATQFPTQITVWAGSRIDAVQLTYPAGGGPSGATQTPRMGDSNGGSPNIFPISPDLPIIRTLVSYDYPPYTNLSYAISTLQFIFSNGNGNTLSQQMGAKQGRFQSGNVGYDYYALSSIYIHGVNAAYGNSADCIVFGFMRWPPQ